MNRPSGAIILWFRQDLRLADHPALSTAAASGAPVVPVYIWSPQEEGGWAPGAASRWWLHQSLRALGENLKKRGSRLILRDTGSGGTLATLRTLAKACGARALYFSRRYEPAAIELERKIEQRLRADGLEVRSFNTSLLWEPDAVRTKSGGPFRVFTPFWNACRALSAPAEPKSTPNVWKSPPRWPTSLKLDQLKLEPRIDWASGFRRRWTPCEKGARTRLKKFNKERLGDYRQKRDMPGEPGTSRFSPYLHFGEIGPRQIWHAVLRHGMFAGGKRRAAAQGLHGEEAYLRQLAWREFAHHLLCHFPYTAEQPMRPEFKRMRWVRDSRGLAAWQNGQTGYPIVDAGMRELWTTGWMHNRVRMIVASFLVKDLGISWMEGARWFWDTLVDADLANNTLGWQWTAGCGADAAPYFRIFNPVAQGERFDPKGLYVRRWVPELARLPGAWIHNPWEAPPDLLSEAGIVLGKTYPRPLVNHSEARERALDAFAALKKR